MNKTEKVILTIITMGLLIASCRSHAAIPALASILAIIGINTSKKHVA